MGVKMNLLTIAQIDERLAQDRNVLASLSGPGTSLEKLVRNGGLNVDQKFRQVSRAALAEFVAQAENRTL